MSFPLSVYETRHGTPGGANPRRARVPMLAHRRMVRDNGLSAVPCIRPLPRLALPCLASPGPAALRPALPSRVGGKPPVGTGIFPAP